MILTLRVFVGEVKHLSVNQVMLSYTLQQIHTLDFCVELPAKRHFNAYFALCSDRYAAKKVWVLFTCGSFDLLPRKIMMQFGSIFDICVCFECISDKEIHCKFTW